MYDKVYFTDNVYTEAFWNDSPFWAQRFRLLMEEFSFTSFLDIGCGLGSLVQAALDEGIDARGLDGALYAVENSKAPGSVDLVDLNTSPLPYPSSSFGLVVAFDILEHLDPVRAEFIVSELCRVAATYVVVKVPVTKIIHQHQVELYLNHFSCLPVVKQLALLTDLSLWVADYEYNNPPEHICVLSRSTWCRLFLTVGVRQIVCSDNFYNFSHFPVKDTFCFMKIPE